MNITVIDAVMGTGKTTHAINTIKEQSDKRFIVVVPLESEVQRFEEELKDEDAVVCLTDENHKAGTTKAQQFANALTEARVIVTTHALYIEFLDYSVLDRVKEGKWSLIMDETVTAFEPLTIKDWTLKPLLDEGVLKTEPVTENVEQLLPTGKTADVERKADKVHVNIIRKTERMDIYKVLTYRKNTKHKLKEAVQEWFVFALQKERLEAFVEVIVLTYPFLGSGLDYWFQIKGIEVNHLQLIRRNNKLLLKPHCGKYGGRQFRHLIEFVDDPLNLKKKPYGTFDNHFSGTEMDKVFNPKTRSRVNLGIQNDVKNSLMTNFRNKRDDSRKFTADKFMWSCKKDCIEAFVDRNKGLNRSFLEKSHIAYNTRATNKYRYKTQLAYLYNVYDFPHVVQMINAHNLKYDDEKYALHVLLQWVWRSAIRDGKKIRLYLPSKRMRRILEDWLNGCDAG